MIVEATQYIKDLEGCCLRGMPASWTMLQCPYFLESVPDEATGFVVCEIQYGTEKRWAVVEDSQDYTGHG